MTDTTRLRTVVSQEISHGNVLWYGYGLMVLGYGLTVTDAMTRLREVVLLHVDMAAADLSPASSPIPSLCKVRRGRVRTTSPTSDRTFTLFPVEFTLLFFLVVLTYFGKDCFV